MSDKRKTRKGSDQKRRATKCPVVSSQFVADISLKRDTVESFDRYPFCLPALRVFERLEFHPAVTFFIGENGSGKSTLLEAIAVCCGFNAEGGSKNFRFGTRDSHSSLHRYLRIARGLPRPSDGFFFRAESFFNVATEIERLDVGPSYGARSLHEQRQSAGASAFPCGSLDCFFF
jgi:predicted ATPase